MNEQAAHHERPGHTVKGPWVVAATLSLFVLVPILVVVIVLATKREASVEPPLDWEARADWPRTYYTAFKSLERGMMSNARTNEVYKDLGFHLSAEEQLAVMRCETLAKQPRELFTTETTRRQLEDEIVEQPGLFYAHFLLATWHTLHDDPVAAEAYFRQAFEHAPAVLMRHHLSAGGDKQSAAKAAKAAVPTLAFAADQIVDDQLDRSVVLVYPYLTTDAQGFIYLPMYKAILRPEDPDLPAGVTDLREKYPWFTFAGRFGRLPDVTLE